MRHSYTPSLTELQTFVAIASFGTTTRAGEEIGLTQSAVSRALGTLEERLGVALFLRVRRRLVLSDAGRALLRDATRLLDDLDAAALTVMSFGGHRDVLRLATLPSFGAEWLMPRLASFARQAPEVTFDMVTTLSPVDFDSAPFDFAIYRGDASPGVRALTLVEEKLVVVAAPELAGKAPLDDAALLQLPLLQQSTRPNLWRDWFGDDGKDPLRPLRGARFEQFGMVLAAARAGMGAALVPEVLADQDLANGTLVRAALRAVTTETPYRLFWPERSDAIPAFQALRAHLIASQARRPVGRPGR